MEQLSDREQDTAESEGLEHGSPHLTKGEAGAGSDSDYELSEESEYASYGEDSEEEEQPVQGVYAPESQHTHHDIPSPTKRLAEDQLSRRPFKRQKGLLNPEYVDILNRDIDDAAHRVCLEDQTDLPPSQVGLVFWTALEKKQFFEAISRLGRHDLPGIAARIESKSIVEVKQYLHILQEASEGRTKYHGRSFLEPAEYPAAVELSQPCCHAQEEAADAISIRQEVRESQHEEAKWDKYWDITPHVAASLEKELQEGSFSSVRFSQIFHTSRWLKLSDRMFMNSSIPGSNWHNIDDRPPSMWATTFDDFYSLAVSVTRRLVQSTLFISMSRIRAKSELLPGTRNVVRKKDVEAAVASLGLSHNSRDWWAKSARRLRLDVYKNPPGRKEDTDEDPMSYEDIEEALADQDDVQTEGASEHQRLAGSPSSADEQDSALDSEDEDSRDEERDELNSEANEMLWYVAGDVSDIQSARRALRLRIATERRQEDQADAMDDYASLQAESEMWQVLQKRPPMELPRMQDPGPLQRSNLDVENIYPMDRAWADRLQYYEEWETLEKPLNTLDGEDDYD
ncbi:hypothetical protein K4F52_003461 [Lecanicillium sp. MT-2017a]|nr:hypothetical protein K4F52_003461 [Lecanicillium sp. MT-2017a]